MPQSRIRRSRGHTLIDVGLDAFPCAAVLVDAQGRICGSNRRAARIFGGKRSALYGCAISELIPDWNSVAASDDSSHSRSQRLDADARRLDGSRFPLRYTRSVAQSKDADVTLLCLTDATRLKATEVELRDSRYGFRQIAQALPQMLWTCRPDGVAEYFSPRWLSLTGRSLESQQGAGWLEQVHPDERSSIEADWLDAVRHVHTFKADCRVRCHDGQYRWIELTSVPVSDRDGVLVRWMGANSDVHEAREDRRALVEERDRFSKLVASAPGVVYAYRLRPDGSSSFPIASAGIKELYGFAAEELAQDASLSVPLIHPQDKRRILASIMNAAETLVPWHSEFRVLNPERGELWVEGRAVPTREADGSTLFYGILMDVTERKRAEEELRRSEARLQAAIKASGIGTWIWELEAGRVWWDDAMYALCDRTREGLFLQVSDTTNLIHEDDRERVTTAMADAFKGGAGDFSLEFRLARPDDALQWITVTGGIDRDEKGRAVRLIGATIDVTERKRAEESQRYSQKIEALGTLAGGIAHDFNNILLAIAGNTKLAMAELARDHPVQRGLAEIEKASVRATDLVHRILAFSRQSEPKRGIISLQPTVVEAVRLLRATLPAMIGIRCICNEELPTVLADSTQIHQIVMNLITNSAHAIGDEAGLVTVTLDAVDVHGGDTRNGELKPGKYVRVSVADTGRGMTKAVRDRIFDPFFTTKPAGQGTGLGLSVVHGIVRSHEGAITVTSEPGSGATFRLYFPAATQPVDDAQEVAREAEKGGGQRIMYVDDEDSLVYLASRMLQRLGYQVSGFTDPGKALHFFQQHAHDFDVVVTDVSMPGMSGFHLARGILDARPNTPILMTSGYVRPQDREAAQKLGVRDLILKPDTIDELGHALHRVFSQQMNG